MEDHGFRQCIYSRTLPQKKKSKSEMSDDGSSKAKDKHQIIIILDVSKGRRKKMSSVVARRVGRC